MEAAEKSPKIRFDPGKTRIGPVESPFMRDDTSLGTCILMICFGLQYHY